MSEKLILFDTPILVHADNIDSMHHKVAEELRYKAIKGEIDACVTPQILLELFAILTSLRVEHPLPPQEALRIVQVYYFAEPIRKIFPRVSTLNRTIQLCEKYSIKGQEIYNAFLAAIMLDNGVEDIYTDNPDVYSKFTEIKASNPFV